MRKAAGSCAIASADSAGVPILPPLGCRVRTAITYAEVTPHTIKDLIQTIGLPHVIVQPRGKHFAAMAFESRGRDRDNPDVLPAIERPDPFRRFDPVHHRHPQVHPNELRTPFPESLHSCLAVFSHTDLKACISSSRCRTIQFSGSSSTMSTRYSG